MKEKFQEALLNILEDLKESEGKLSSILSSMTDLVLVVDNDGILTFYHAPKNSLFNKYKLSIGSHYSKVLPPHVTKLIDKALKKTIKGNNTEFEYQLQIKDKILWFRVKFSPLKIDKEIKGLVAVVSNITNKKKKDIEIEESRNMLKTVINTIPQRVFWKDKKLNYLGCNEMFAKDSGLDSAKKIIGMNDFQLSWKDQAKIYRADDAEIIKKGVGKSNYEEPQTTPTGDTIWLRTSKVPLKNTKGDIIGILGTYDDITEKKKQEKELQKLREEDEINQARKNFLLLITHELKQPLTPIMGYADLLKEQLTDVNQLKYLDRIIGGSQEMYELITKIINLMRLETGQLLFNYKEFSLKDLIDKSLRKKASLINLRNIKIEKKVKDAKVKGDFNLLRDVMVNLIDNAIKFSKDYKTITVEAKTRKGEVIISVKDQGIGIKKEDLPKLFKTFSQTIEGRKKGGFGIGLSLIKMIVEKHKGTVSVDSELGKGSTFTIKLPQRGNK